MNYTFLYYFVFVVKVEVFFMKKRNTIQRMLVKDMVKNYCGHPTAQDIYEKISAEYPGISMATVYRNLHNLAQEGELASLCIPGQPEKYDSINDVYVCPNQQELTYSTTNREGYRQYVSDPSICKQCPMLTQCTRSKNTRKVVTRHVWEDSKDWVRENRLSLYGKMLYPRRKETIERSFADAKELHGLRYCRFRGLEKVREQCLMVAAVQNIKRIASLMWRQERRVALA